jgi:hypothetical protein
MPSPARTPLAARLAALTLYGAAMGWLEAVVVIYIRALTGMGPGMGMPAQEEVMRRFAELPWLMPTEQGREAATILMLVAVGILAARGWPARFGAFLIAFGVWDITYYIALRILLGWPPSLLTYDLLFFIPPHPWWYQPVLVPVVISCGMVAWGVWLLRGDRPGAGAAREDRAPQRRQT